MEITQIVFLSLILVVVVWFFKSTLRDLYHGFRKPKTGKVFARPLSEAAISVQELADQGDAQGFIIALENGGASLVAEATELLRLDLEFTRRLAECFPDSALARFIYGDKLCDEAFKVRTGARAEDVSAQQFDVFKQYLIEAAAELYTAHDRDPQFPLVYASLMAVQLGLSQKDDLLLWAERGEKVAPGLIDYRLTVVTALTKKWLGSHEEMFAWARRYFGNSTHPVVNALIPFAHIEYWTQLPKSERATYFENKAVKKEINDAYRHFCKPRQAMIFLAAKKRLWVKTYLRCASCRQRITGG
jgi:hypothetical protein